MYEPEHRLVIAHHNDRRGNRAAKKLWKKIPVPLQGCLFETDALEAYKTIIPSQQHRVGKQHTYWTEGFSATIPVRVSRLVRSILSLSEKDICIT